MADFVAMTIVYGLDYLFEYFFGLCFRKVAVVDYSIEQLSAFTQFHYEVDISLIFKSFKKFDNMRMVLDT